MASLARQALNDAARRRSTLKTAIAAAVASLLLAGCHGSRNDVCVWPSDDAGRSLVDDVRLAEDLAIRYADAQGKRASWRSDREACEAALFQTVANRHASSLAEIADIRDGLGQRRLDLAVYGPMLLLCALAAWHLVRAATRRFVASEPIPRLFAVALGTVVIAVAIVGIGQVWAGVIETLRLGNGHLSYRASRIPWGYHRLSTSIGVALVVLITLVFHSWMSTGSAAATRGTRS